MELKKINLFTIITTFLMILYTSHSIAKTCLLNFENFKTPVFRNCMLIISDQNVQEVFISQNKTKNLKSGPTRAIYDENGMVVGVVGGDIYEGQFDFIPFDKKSPNFTTFSQCSSGQRKILIQMIPEMLEAIKKQCKSDKTLTKEDRKFCKFVKDNTRLNWSFTKNFWKFYASQIYSQLGPIKFEISENSSIKSGKFNFGPSLIKIEEFKKNKYGFLNASTSSGLSVLLNDNPKSSLSLYGGFGALNYKGNCSQ